MSFPCRAPRRLPERQRQTWGQHPNHKPRWSRWPLRGSRISEAARPGPATPGTPVGGERPSLRRRDRSLLPDAIMVDGVGPTARLYCPVPGCPSSRQGERDGQANRLIAHVDSHLAGKCPTSASLSGMVCTLHASHPPELPWEGPAQAVRLMLTTCLLSTNCSWREGVPYATSQLLPASA